MVLIPVRCPQCHSDQVIKGGVTKADKQRYRCQNSSCPRYSYRSPKFAVKSKIALSSEYE
jgi:transposase-like protein